VLPQHGASSAGAVCALREPLLALHVGYGRLAVGLLPLSFNGIHAVCCPRQQAAHALTVGVVASPSVCAG
jgi:hypothetical protein